MGLGCSGRRGRFGAGIGSVEEVFVEKDTSDMGVDVALADFTIGDGLHHIVYLRESLLGGDNNIGAGSDGIVGTISFGTLHIQGISDNQSGEGHITAEEILDNDRRDGSGEHSGIDGRDGKMTDHNTRESIFDPPSEGIKIDRIHLIEATFDHPLTEVGIGRDGTMTGEMLCHTDDISIFEATGVSQCEVSHTMRVIAERSAAHKGVTEADIDHRAEHHINTNNAAFSSEFTTIVIENLIVDIGSNIAIERELGSIGESHSESPLGVDCYERGDARIGL